MVDKLEANGKSENSKKIVFVTQGTVAVGYSPS
jgi:hypothetical protein